MLSLLEKLTPQQAVALYCGINLALLLTAFFIRHLAVKIWTKKSNGREFGISVDNCPRDTEQKHRGREVKQ
jgi:hypothetical protein